MMSDADSTREAGLPADTSVGRVRLRVANLERAREFYVQRLGLVEFESSAESASFGPTDGKVLVTTDATAGTRRRPEGTNGLYHFAILFPDRAALARAIAHLQATRWPFQGFSDHGVSEAAYLADPDGNGVELYADRPRRQWSDADGRLVMYSRPLDLKSLFREIGNSTESAPAPARTRMGHVHLHVSDLGSAERFWSGVIGFDVMTRDYPGALFLSAGGYHHHLAVNTWARGSARPDDVAGLQDFVIRTASDGTLQSIQERARRAGADCTPTREGLRLKDDDGNVVIVGTDADQNRKS